MFPIWQYLQEICPIKSIKKVKVCHGKDSWRPKVNDKFYSVQSKTHQAAAMEQNPENYDLGLKDANVKSLKKNADSLKRSHECNQCDYASSHTGHLRQTLTRILDLEKSREN